MLIGLWIGAFFISPGLLSPFSKTISYIMGMLSDRSNLDVLLFLYVFSGLVATIQIAGGVKGFEKLMERWVHTKTGAQLASWALVPITFIDCGFRVVAAGSIIKPLAKKFGVSNERLAFNLNNSASPLISLIPIATTYVGYMIGTIAVGLRTAGISGSPFVVFLKTIPFNFFSLTAIVIAFLSIFSPWQFSAMKQADQKASESQGETENHNSSHKHAKNLKGVPSFGLEIAKEPVPSQDNIDTANDQMGVATGKDIDIKNSKEKNPHHKMAMNMEHDHDMNIESKLPARAFNLIIPIGFLIPISFLMVWLDGRTKANTLLGIFSSANASSAMFQALFITTILTAILYLFQGLSLKNITNSFIKGGNKLMVTIVILAVAWPIATVSKDLGLPVLIKNTLGTTLPTMWVPVVIFLVTSAVTYFIGSSWGAWALMMPLAIPLAAISGASIPISAAAVFSGGTFGDVTSPLSGMTAMSSGIAEVKHMDYIKAMTPYNLTAGIAAATLFLFVPILG